MSAIRHRRQFLRSAAAVAGAAACGLAGSWPNHEAAAIEPIDRHAKPKFKFSLAAYSYRDLLTGMPPKLTLEDFIADCAAMNLDGTELTSYYFPAEPSRDYLNHLKNLCFRMGLDISGTAVRNDFCHEPGEKRDAEIAHVKNWIEYAAILGAPVIRVYSGKPTGKQTVEDAHRLAVQAFEECCEHAGRHGVFLAIENHGGLTETADGLLAIVRDVRSPWFGINLDSGNFRTADPYGDLVKIAPYALNMQVKVVMKPSGGSPVPTDFERLAKILRDANYRGYVVLEYEEKKDPRGECARYVDVLRKTFTS